MKKDRLIFALIIIFLIVSAFLIGKYAKRKDKTLSLQEVEILQVRIDSLIEVVKYNHYNDSLIYAQKDSQIQIKYDTIYKTVRTGDSAVNHALKMRLLSAYDSIREAN